jgi:hypothetical protein
VSFHTATMNRYIHCLQDASMAVLAVVGRWGVAN